MGLLNPVERRAPDVLSWGKKRPVDFRRVRLGLVFGQFVFVIPFL